MNNGDALKALQYYYDTKNPTADEPYDKEDGDFYDLFYLTEKPGKYTVKHRGKKIEIEVTEENGEKAIGYG